MKNSRKFCKEMIVHLKNLGLIVEQKHLDGKLNQEHINVFHESSQKIFIHLHYSVTKNPSGNLFDCHIHFSGPTEIEQRLCRKVTGKYSIINLNHMQITVTDPKKYAQDIYNALQECIIKTDEIDDITTQIINR